MFAVRLGSGVGLGIALAAAYVAKTTDVTDSKLPVDSGKTRIRVAGYTLSPYTAHSHLLADKIAHKYPDKYDTKYYWAILTFHKFLIQKFDKVSFKDLGAENLKNHDSSPFVWLESSPEPGAEPKVVKLIGGNDRFCEWVQQQFPEDKELVELSKKRPETLGMLNFVNEFCLVHYNKWPETASYSGK
jgi:hypothetical protein